MNLLDMFRVFAVMTIALTLLVASTVLIITHEGNEMTRYDCSLAEFHPDFSPAMKEKCRRLRMIKE